MGKYSTIFQEKRAGFVYPYLTCRYHEEVPFFCHKWLGYVPAQNMRSGLLRCMVEYKKKQDIDKDLPWVADFSELDKFDPEVVDWLHDEWIKKLCEEKVQFYVFIIPQEMFFRKEIDKYRNSILQMKCDLEVRYFTNMTSALIWLGENKKEGEGLRQAN